MKQYGWALLATLVVLQATPPVHASELSTAINYVGRFLGWGWSDGYHSGQRPGSGFRGHPGVSAPHGDYFSGGRYLASPVGESIPAPSFSPPRAAQPTPAKPPSSKFDPSVRPRDAGDDQLPAPPPRPTPEMSFSPAAPATVHTRPYDPAANRTRQTPNTFPTFTY